MPKNNPQLYIPQTRILDPRNQGLEPEAGSLGFARGVIRTVDEHERTVELVISSGEIDRYGEIVDPKAFEPETVNAFMSNPVILAGHQHIGPSGEPTIVGHWLSIKREGSLTVGVAKLATTDLAQTYWQLILDGALRACSIGFIVREWEMREVGSGKTKMRVRVFTKIELVEISLVAVPANREALMKAAGFNQIGGDENGGGGSTEEAAKALADAIAEQLKGDIAEQITAAMDTHVLNTDPGGPLACLIQDVVEACQVTRDHLDDVDVSEVGGNSGGKSGESGGGVIDEVMRTLRGIKPKA